METIYTIPINEAFEEAIAEKENGVPICPFCTVAKKLEEDELDLILGASMMEPDIRVKTNEMGFCSPCFDKMLRRQKRLPLALMLESHLSELHGILSKKGVFGTSAEKGTKLLSELKNDCYVCHKVKTNLTRMLSNAVYMWERDGEFVKKVRAQRMICLEHLSGILTAAQGMNKKKFSALYEDFSTPAYSYLAELCGDVSHFCKKFDYRYEDEPWGNSKDSVERAIRFLTGEKLAK
ncbi:MAG: hypothetical protein IJW46_02750 [Clostridia bacterium]|nr:hypothetical protein [Clostridia bacterium]